MTSGRLGRCPNRGGKKNGGGVAKAGLNRSDWSRLGRFWGHSPLSAPPWHSSFSQKETRWLLDKEFSQLVSNHNLSLWPQWNLYFLMLEKTLWLLAQKTLSPLFTLPTHPPALNSITLFMLISGGKRARFQQSPGQKHYSKLKILACLFYLWRNSPAMFALG